MLHVPTVVLTQSNYRILSGKVHKIISFFFALIKTCGRNIEKSKYNDTTLIVENENLNTFYEKTGLLIKEKNTKVMTIRQAASFSADEDWWKKFCIFGTISNNKRSSN